MLENSNLPVSQWAGANTKRVYRCTVYPLNPTLRDLGIPDFEDSPSPLPGIYIFSKSLRKSSRYPHNKHYPSIYIGQTEDLKKRFDNHCQLECIRSKEGTCFHVYITGFEQKPALDLNEKDVREEIECDLQNKYQALCPRWKYQTSQGVALLVGGVSAPSQEV